MFEINKPQFDTSSTLRSSTMTMDNLSDWKSKFPDEHMQKRLVTERSRHYYSFAFIVHGRIVKTLTSMGFSPSLASEIAAGFTLLGNSDPRLPDRNPCELFAADYTYLVVKGRTGWVVPAYVKTTVFDLKLSTLDPTPTPVLLAIDVKQIFQETCFALGLDIGTDDKMRLVPVER